MATRKILLSLALAVLILPSLSLFAEQRATVLLRNGDRVAGAFGSHPASLGLTRDGELAFDLRQSYKILTEALGTLILDEKSIATHREQVEDRRQELDHFAGALAPFLLAVLFELGVAQAKLALVAA